MTYASAMNTIWRSELSTHERALLSVIVTRRQGDELRATYAQLAEWSGICERSVMMVSKALVSAGWLGCTKSPSKPAIWTFLGEPGTQAEGERGASHAPQGCTTCGVHDMQGASHAPKGCTTCGDGVHHMHPTASNSDRAESVSSRFSPVSCPSPPRDAREGGGKVRAEQTTAPSPSPPDPPCDPADLADLVELARSCLRPIGNRGRGMGTLLSERESQLLARLAGQYGIPAVQAALEDPGTAGTERPMQYVESILRSGGVKPPPARLTYASSKPNAYLDCRPSAPLPEPEPVAVPPGRIQCPACEGGHGRATCGTCGRQGHVDPAAALAYVAEVERESLEIHRPKAVPDKEAAVTRAIRARVEAAIAAMAPAPARGREMGGAA